MCMANSPITNLIPKVVLLSAQLRRTPATKRYPPADGECDESPADSAVNATGDRRDDEQDVADAGHPSHVNVALSLGLPVEAPTHVRVPGRGI